jgi:hypothetical protein
MNAELTQGSDGRRTGATWMAATGAFLLLAAAAVFVAVRWGTMPDGAKAAIVGGLTGAFLLSGRTLRRTLPATGDVLFHLGAFLVPVDLAGANLRIAMPWRQHLLAQGLVCVASFGALAAVSNSVVLNWAAAAAVVVLAAAVSATSAVPAPLVLAVAAVGLTLARPRARAALGWAALAGLAPVVSLATLSITSGRGVLTELGVLGHDQLLASVATGALAAFVLGREARARRDLALAFTAVASGIAGLATSWLTAERSADADLVGLGAILLVVELTALLTRRDPFWWRPAAILADLSEAFSAIAVYAGAAAIVAVTAMGDLDRSHPTLGITAALVAAGWFAADLRRRQEDGSGFGLALLIGAGSPITTIPLAVSAVGTVIAASGSLVSGAVAMVVVAALLVLSGRALGHGTAVALTIAAPLLAREDPVAVAVVGVAGVAVLASAAIVRSGLRDACDVLLALFATTLVLETALVLGVTDGRDAFAVGGAIGACWLLAVALDRGRSLLGHVARAGAVVALVAAVPFPASEVLAAAVLFTVLAVADAVRLDHPRIGVAAACSVQLVVVQLALLADLELAAIGLVLCVAAVVWAGLGGVVSDHWRLPFLVATGIGVGAGLVASSADPQYFGDAVVVTGALLVAAAIATRVEAVAHVGGGLIIVGSWTHLATGEVQVTEAYVLPVAVHLVLAGARARRVRPLSSWVAYGPAIGLLGLSALDERLGGGAGWHALVAGCIGVAAVAAGGWRRLSGPLVIGTALVVSVTLHETLAAVASVPTWLWLATGGTVLLGLGVQLERTDTSPVEAGRRVVDVMTERFE